MARGRVVARCARRRGVSPVCAPGRAGGSRRPSAAPRDGVPANLLVPGGYTGAPLRTGLTLCAAAMVVPFPVPQAAGWQGHARLQTLLEESRKPGAAERVNKTASRVISSLQVASKLTRVWPQDSAALLLCKQGPSGWCRLDYATHPDRSKAYCWCMQIGADRLGVEAG